VLAKTTIARKLTVSSSAAWEAISGIGRLDAWFPSIATCRVEGSGAGAHRHMTLEGGGAITDRIVEIDRAARRLTYQRIESPFPVTSYRGTVEVFESFDSSAVVVWTVDFESAPQVVDALAGALDAAIGAGIEGMNEDLKHRAEQRER
jgi:Polyketide cyclase / dehydrase and lipid transport